MFSQLSSFICCLTNSFEIYSLKFCLISLPWLGIDNSLLLCHQMLKQIRTIVGCAVELSFWDLMTTHEVFQYSVPHFFSFNGIACKTYIIQLAIQALQRNKISEISCLCYTVSSMFMIFTFFSPIESLIAQYGLYSQGKKNQASVSLVSGKMQRMDPKLESGPLKSFSLL